MDITPKQTNEITNKKNKILQKTIQGLDNKRPIQTDNIILFDRKITTIGGSIPS